MQSRSSSPSCRVVWSQCSPDAGQRQGQGKAAPAAASDGCIDFPLCLGVPLFFLPLICLPSPPLCGGAVFFFVFPSLLSDAMTDHWKYSSCPTRSLAVRCNLASHLTPGAASDAAEGYLKGQGRRLIAAPPMATSTQSRAGGRARHQSQSRRCRARQWKVSGDQSHRQWRWSRAGSMGSGDHGTTGMQQQSPVRVPTSARLHPLLLHHHIHHTSRHERLVQKQNTADVGNPKQEQNVTGDPFFRRRVST